MDDDIIVARIRLAFDSIEPPSQAAFPQVSKARSGLRFVAAFALLAVAAGAGWLSLGIGNSAEAWQAIPLPQDSWIISRAEQACGESEASEPINAGLPFSLVDARGSSAVAFFTDGQRFVTCQFSWDRNGDVLIAVASVGGTLGPSDGLDMFSARTSSQGEYLMVIGRAGGAASVNVELGDGTPVRATVTDGYYLAWWPEPRTVRRIAGVDVTGKVIATLEPPLGQ